MKSRWPLLSIFIVLLLFASVSAEGVTLKADPINNVIPWDGTATYTTTITNQQSSSTTFDLRSPILHWGDIIFDKPSVTLSAGKSTTVGLKINPPKDIRVGAYSLEITARSSTNPNIVDSEYIRVYINTELPKIEPTFEGLPTELTSDIINLKLVLQNTGSSAVDNITGRLESDLGFGPFELDIGSFALEEKKVVLTETFDIDTTRLADGNYKVKLILLQNGEEIGRFTKYVSVGAGSGLNVDEQYKEGLLTREHTVTIKNIGNIQISDVWTAELASWSRYFLSGDPEPSETEVRDGKMILTWKFALNPGASTIIQYKISYVPLAIVLALIIILIYSTFWYFRQDFTLIKELMSSSDRNGKSLKVKLRIRNNTNSKQTHVIIIDSVPLPLKVSKEFDLIEPKQIKKKGNSVHITWRFDEMDPGEERVISYKLRSAIGVIGVLTLPAARLRCKIKDKPRTFASNKLVLRSEHLKHTKKEEHKPSKKHHVKHHHKHKK